jgi:hypothetical protein
VNTRTRNGARVADPHDALVAAAKAAREFVREWQLEAASRVRAQTDALASQAYALASANRGKPWARRWLRKHGLPFHPTGRG